jgi:signal transduction histidine kinase
MVLITVMQSQQEFILLIVASAFLILILVGSVITMFFFRKKHHKFLNEVEQVKINLKKELFKTHLEIQEDTFEFISLELHDHVGHFLSLARLHLTTFGVPIAEEIKEKMEAANLLIGQSLEEIRNISRSLNGENIKNNGLIDTVHQHIEQLEKAGPFKVKLTITGTTCYLDDVKETVLFRIMQESLNNIVKHSKASLIHIILHYNGKELILTIRDNGVGFRVENYLNGKKQQCSGLKNIVKRCSMINAQAEIISMPEKGTTISITTPY